jgi:hypothetical protein
MAAAAQKVIGDALSSGRATDVTQTDKQKLLAHGNLPIGSHVWAHHRMYPPATAGRIPFLFSTKSRCNVLPAAIVTSQI